MLEEEEISRHVETVLDSELFNSSPRLAKLLTFCVNTSLAGEEETLKESTIGVMVFGRPPGYDTKLDPIVRVSARRLRQTLDLFYKSEGRQANVQIILPKGSYIPKFDCFPGGVPASKSTDIPVLSLDLPAPAPESYRKLDWRIWTLLAVVPIVVITVVFFKHLTKLPSISDSESSGSALRPLTSLPGLKTDPSWSPDGKKIAFSWDRNESGIPHVYLQNRDSVLPVSLSRSTAPEVRPVWSEDGRSIALLREIRPGFYQLVLVEVATRKERILRSIEFSYAFEKPALDWSPDGRWFISSEQQGERPAHLILISPTDGTSRQITDPPDGSTGDIEARFSPDSQEVAFRRGGLGDVFLMSIVNPSSPSTSPLTFSNPGVRGLSWSRDGRSIFFGSPNGGIFPSIWRLDRENGSLTRVTPLGMAAISPSNSRDGNELLFSTASPAINLWRYQVGKGLAPHPLHISTRIQITPRISPDGKMIVFVSDMSGTMELWSSSIDNPEPRQVTKLSGEGIPFFPSWSADGKMVAFFCRKKGLNYAFEIPVKGGSARLLRGGIDYTQYPQYSPDGKLLYLLSDSDHRYRVLRISLANLTSPPEEVTMEDVSYFRLTPDGQTLYFSSRERGATTLIRKDLRTNQQQTVWEWKQEQLNFSDWDVVNNRLFFIASQDGSLGQHLVVADLQTHKQQDLGKIRTGYWLGVTGIAASPDGNSVWVSQVDRDDSNVASIQLQ